jgi:DNA modification methylase
MPSESIDAIVTDPPYGFGDGKRNGFMGKQWDYDVPSVDIWAEALRVLKPGGHLLAFAGTRTQHRMAVRIEDAGFEIRDMLAWVYSQGFPKSLSIGKALDKMAGAEREVVGKYKRPDGTDRPNRENWSGLTGTWKEGSGFDPTKDSITTPATPEAQQWEGWGTALKPSWESITVAQKQLDSSAFFMIELVYKLKEVLCQLQSFATTAEKVLALSQQGQKEGADIARWIAEKNTNTQEDLSVLMDMLRSESEKNLNWNIVLLWLNILEEICKATNIYTTSTELSTTIELRTLLSMEWESIFQSITQANDNPTSGLSANVYNAESIFNALRLKLETIHELFAEEPVISKAGKLDLRPNLSPIIMSRKPLSEKTVAENVRRWGTGGINIDGGRVDAHEGKTSGGCKGDRRKIGYGYKPMPKEYRAELNNIGRFPANFCHDGSEEVLAGFPETKNGGQNATTLTAGTSMFGVGANKGKGATSFAGDTGSASRFFYCAKASPSERNAGVAGVAGVGALRDKGRASSPKRNHHPTVKPIALMRYLVRLITPPGGIVLDPFMGSGTTGIAAQLEGFGFIGIERESEYVEIARARIAHFSGAHVYAETDTAEMDTAETQAPAPAKRLIQQSLF